MRAGWSVENLVESWTLVDDDWLLLANKAGSTRLGFAICLKFFELERRFPKNSAEVSDEVVAFVADQVRVDPDAFSGYEMGGRSAS